MAFYENQQQAQFTNVIALVNEALKQKCWIFNPQDKSWFPPEEFLTKYGKARYEQDWIKQFKVMNPIAGLKAAEIQAQRLNEEKMEFQQRVFEYYQNKAR